MVFQSQLRSGPCWMTRLSVSMVYTGADDASRREAIGKLSALFGTDTE